MARDEHTKIDQPSELDRRTVLTGGAAVAATAALPRASLGQSNPNAVQPFGAIYKDFGYLQHFNHDKYSAGNIQNVQDLIKGKGSTPGLFPNRSALKWGLYQQSVEPTAANWGSTPKKGQAAFDKWPDFSQDARDDLERQPATFTDPKNAMNPFDTTQVAANLMEHLDEVIRIALWDHAVPMKIVVGSKEGRHHGLTTEWQPAPQPGTNPNLQLTGLTINMDCPDGGWEGYTVWRNQSSTAEITKIVASWTVPPAPTGQDGQIIFIFIGLESVSGTNATGGILQPVLQWTDSGPNAGWYIRSWYVTAAFDPLQYPLLPDPSIAADQAHLANENRCYSQAVPVQAKDTITGTIQGGRNSTTGKFDYMCSLEVNGQHKSVTDLSLTDIPEPVYAVCAVESYGAVNKPQDYPAPPTPGAASITLSSINLQVQNNSVHPIQWVDNKNNLGLDFKATHNMGGDKVEFKLA
ncbi:hypothetical protein [Bradyrhizobium manausense]|uniref:Uncharacterized protein n=1 Tax=Bradyrhizobium manausense TaxID=989370 RepID=A0A0R3DRE6_9BRAD|nr:hypothetical protein [Bradyrhizobium manausense]KRQ10268.1 hypothetical protein AOQ71_20115 [Bradyrhizobium manausense]